MIDAELLRIAKIYADNDLNDAWHASEKRAIQFARALIEAANEIKRLQRQIDADRIGPKDMSHMGTWTT